MKTIYTITKIVNNRMQVVARIANRDAAIEKMIELSNEIDQAHFIHGRKMSRALYFTLPDQSGVYYAYR